MTHSSTRIHTAIFLGLCTVFSTISLGVNSSAAPINVHNDRLSLNFDSANGVITSFKDTKQNYDFLSAENVTSASLWQIETRTSGSQIISPRDAKKFSYHAEGTDRVTLTWTGFRHLGSAETSASVSVNISLADSNAGSKWDIALDGIQGEKIYQVKFPHVTGLRDLENERLAVPMWMGELHNNPRAQLASPGRLTKKMDWYYPGFLSMQMLALYGKHGGLYLSANDTESYYKEMGVALDPAGNLTYELTNDPPLDPSLNSYKPAYSATIDSFTGDWYSAAARYREWGTKQEWSKKSRLKNNQIPQWVTDTALWVWNRDSVANVLPPAIDLRNQLNLPVSVLWHWWHADSYDDSFPEYLPPRDGASTFTAALNNARKNDVNAIVYMNSIKWGPETESFKKENAEKISVKNLDGKPKSHVYNIFTKKALTYICLTSDYWRSKYTALAKTVTEQLGASGVYMDQACLSVPCYDTTHNHKPGGGNYWVKSFAAMTEQIRGSVKTTPPIMLAGEGGGEAWLPYLDAFLTLQVSKERYSGISSVETIPLFQAVYHQYALTFGNYSSLLTPPYDSKWPKQFAPDNANQLLPEKFNSQFLMEQARSFVWGMQPAISNYRPFLKTERSTEIDYLIRLAKLRNSAPQFFLKGEFLRPPVLNSPTKVIPISKLSIYAGQNEKVTTFEKSYPLVYSAAWRADNSHSVGIPVASISDSPIPVEITLNAADYDLPESGTLTITDHTGKIQQSQYSNGKVLLKHEIPAYGILLFELH